MITAEEFTVERNGELITIDLPVDFLGKLSTGEDLSFFELRIPFIVGQVPDSSHNAQAGMEPGDLLKRINGQEVTYFDQAIDLLNENRGQAIQATFERNGQPVTLDLKVNDEGKLGIAPTGTYQQFAEMGFFQVVQKKYGFLESFSVGAQKFTNQLGGYWLQLKKIFTPSTGAYKGVGGFKAIFDIFPDTWSWQQFWGITAFLSIMLAVLNLLPIPALDGGHVMFLLYEMVSGRKPSDKFMEYAQMVGFFLLLALIVFANGNDIYKALTK
jgi:regulator of sigma E protease